MKNKKTIKNILMILVIAILGLGVYAFVTGGASGNINANTSSLSSLVGSGNFGEVKESNTDLANAEILRILGSIQNINLDDDIFNNPVFRELEDSRFTIPKPVAIGRPNPFLPIGFDALAQTTIPSTSSAVEQNNPTDSTSTGLSAGNENDETISNFFNQ